MWRRRPPRSAATHHPAATRRPAQDPRCHHLIDLRRSSPSCSRPMTLASSPTSSRRSAPPGKKKKDAYLGPCDASSVVAVDCASVPPPWSHGQGDWCQVLQVLPKFVCLCSFTYLSRETREEEEARLKWSRNNALPPG